MVFVAVFSTLSWERIIKKLANYLPFQYYIKRLVLQITVLINKKKQLITIFINKLL
ncbi:hypothetical protein FLAVO9AF_220018 [Flavobacterium sp. 9AF]|nr:hypothetical protein FLAVO9AF_220018 [Flavobacterium sp. 9AF]